MKIPGICVITSPRPPAGIIPLSNLINILGEITGSLFLITGNSGIEVLKTCPKVKGYSLVHIPHRNIAIRIYRYIKLQCQIIARIAGLNKDAGIFVFFMAEGLFWPVVACKLTRKPVVLVLASSAIKVAQKSRDIFARPVILMEKANYRLASRIVVYSQGLIDEWGLQKYRRKTYVAQKHFLDFASLKITRPFQERKEVVGYIGRLSEEKGILNFVRTIPCLARTRKEIRFIIGGDGPLRDRVNQHLREDNLINMVEFPGWIPHHDIPRYFNEIKLLVLPSYTEGLPNIMLEAMACGTPVLAVPVGSIGEIIKDGFNGYIMENNSPECITRNVIRALDDPDLEKISLNGRLTVQEHYTFDNAVNKYSSMINELCQDST